MEKENKRKHQNKSWIDTSKQQKNHNMHVCPISILSFYYHKHLSVNSGEAGLQFSRWKKKQCLCLAVQTSWPEKMWLWKEWWQKLGIIRFVHWWSTWLKHLLHQIEADTSFALILGHRKVVEQVKMSHVWAIRVSVLVDQPFPFAGVSVSSANVFGLKML